MCGILVWQSLENESPPPDFVRGLEAMVHRGPDSEGTFVGLGVRIGHRRLKIIDLSQSANQPMSLDNGRYRIAFNGEIYNFKALRQHLQQQGHGFATDSDTEVLIRLYQHYGERCLEKLNGMFAFVIHDRRDGSLFLARDRLGIKPLYYRWDGKTFAAASELRALLAAGLAEPEVDADKVREYLRLGAIQAPGTILKGVNALLPGHFIRLRDSRFSIREYWRQPFVPENEKRPETLENAGARVRELLEDATRLRMVSDVPLGAFLSGGMDSSSLVALMSGTGSARIKTFSIGFDVGGKAFNETAYAKRVAERYWTQHHEYILTGRDVVENLDDFVRHLDQPTMDGLNTYFVSKFTRQQVTVCLSGTGGDELFAGYPSAKVLDLGFRLARRVPPVPRAVGHSMRGVFERLPDSWRKSQVLRGLFAGLGAWPSHLDRYLFARTVFSPSDVNHLMGSSAVVRERIPGWQRHTLEALSPADAVCLLEQTVYLRNTLLRDIDAMSMAHSLEVRVPFLDHRLVEYVAGLPAALKYDPRRTKHLLAESMKDVLPQSILARPKMGFSFPLGIWLQQPDMQQILADCFSPRGLPGRGLFSASALKTIYRSGMGGDFSSPRSLKHYSKMWALAVLELWLRELSQVRVEAPTRDSVVGSGQAMEATLS